MLPGNVTTRSDQQPFADDQFTLEPAMHIGIVSGRMPVEKARLGDNNVLAFG